MWKVSVFGIEFFKLFYCFMIYCLVGWIWETCYVSIKDGKLVNRGFLNGPIIPIYGCAATGIFLAFFNPVMMNLASEKSVKSYIIVFFLGAVVASALEYITSFSMEKMFHAKWWDYSNRPLNLNGRICLPVSMFWGLASIFLVKLLHPQVIALIDKLPRETAENIGYFLLVLFVADVLMTVIATVELDRKITAITRIRRELTDITDALRNFEIKLRNGFRDTFGETLVGDAVSHTADRIDATLAFTAEGVDRQISEMMDFRNKSIDEIDKVLAENKERTDKALEENKVRVENVLKSIKGFRRYTAKRLMKAFPNMKPLGDRTGSIAMIASYLSDVRGKINKNIRKKDK